MFLSLGQRQLISFIRTYISEPSIIIFDEATSALDTNTEREIQKSLEDVSADRTTLIIAHRLSTVVDADEILVLDRGSIIERGRHEVLLAAKGEYASLWAQQQEAEKRNLHKLG